MFAGHAAIGVAAAVIARDRRPRVVALLVGASLAADIGWCLLTIAGLEGGRSLGSMVYHSPRFPWSHSFLSTAVLAIVFAALALAVAGRRVALFAALAVFVHWVLADFPFGEGFPLTPWSEPLATPHLFTRWPIAFAIEAATIAACAAMLGRRGLALGIALLVLHVIAWLPSFAGRPPTDLGAQPLAIVGYLVLLLVAWAVSVATTPQT